MDRAFLMALIVFVALAVVGIFLVASPTTFVTAPGDVDALRTVGGALFAAGLAAFLVEAFHSQREREARNA